jgi:hypothetical protein
MSSATIFLHDSPTNSDRNESTRKHSAIGSTLYWHETRPGHGYWAPSNFATTDSSAAAVPHYNLSAHFTPASPVEEHRRSQLASKSFTGLNSLWAPLRSNSNDPTSKRQKRQRPHSTSSVDISSLDVRYSPRSYFQAPLQSSNGKLDTRPDLSAFVPDYLDLPPPYSSPVREHQEVIDWKAHFDRTPLLTTTVSPHSSPAIQDVMSTGTSVGGAWDHVSRRLNR